MPTGYTRFRTMSNAASVSRIESWGSLCGSIGSILAVTAVGAGGMTWWLTKRRDFQPWLKNKAQARAFKGDSLCGSIPHMPLRILVLGDQCAGAENQSKGLVEHLGRLASERSLRLECSFRRILPTRSFRMLPASVHIALQSLFRPILGPSLGLRDADSNTITLSQDPLFGAGHSSNSPPYPDIVIACGRTTAPACVAVRRASGGRTFAVQIQDPRCSHILFDAVVTPAHDAGHARAFDMFAREAASNQLWEWQGTRILTVGSLHGVTCEALAQEHARSAHVVPAHVAGARVVVCMLVGGPTRHCAWSVDDVMCALNDVTAAALRSTNNTHVHPDHKSAEAAQVRQDSNGHVGVIILLSRRTPPDVIHALQEWARAPSHGVQAHVFPHTGFPDGINPFKAVLHMSTAVIVTADSVSMCSEAVSTQRIVVLGCAHRCTGKLARLRMVLQDTCGAHDAAHVREVTRLSDMTTARAPDDTIKIAQRVWERVWERGCFQQKINELS